MTSLKLVMLDVAVFALVEPAFLQIIVFKQALVSTTRFKDVVKLLQSTLAPPNHAKSPLATRTSQLTKTHVFTLISLALPLTGALTGVAMLQMENAKAN